MRTLLATITILLGLALILSGSYLGLVYFIGYDGVWTSELFWILVPMAFGALLVVFGARSLRVHGRPLRTIR